MTVAAPSPPPSSPRPLPLLSNDVVDQIFFRLYFISAIIFLRHSPTATPLNTANSPPPPNNIFSSPNHHQLSTKCSADRSPPPYWPVPSRAPLSPLPALSPPQSARQFSAAATTRKICPLPSHITQAMLTKPTARPLLQPPQCRLPQQERSRCRHWPRRSSCLYGPMISLIRF